MTTADPAVLFGLVVLLALLMLAVAEGIYRWRGP